MEYKKGPFPTAIPFWDLTGTQFSEIHLGIMQRKDTNSGKTQPVGTTNAAGEGKQSNPADLLGLIKPADGLGLLLYLKVYGTQIKRFIFSLFILKLQCLEAHQKEQNHR